jgi:peptide/nickel transport system substrate-binding protein
MTKLSHLLSILFLLVIMTSCGSDPKENAPENNYSTENTVYARLPAEPDRINPFVTTNTYSRIIYENIFLYLLDFDPQTFELKPQLAKGLPEIAEITEGPYAGGVAYTYELFEEAAWDDGSPITGEDVAFTLKILFNPEVNAGPIRTYLEFIKDIEIDPENPKRFTIMTSQKYIIGEAAISNIPIYPAYVYDADGALADITLSDLTNADKLSQLQQADTTLQAFANAFNSDAFAREKGKVVGAGAYAFETWNTGQEIILTRKADWWGDNVSSDQTLLEAAPDTLVFKIIPDQTTAVAALKDQQIDVTAQIDVKDFVELKENELVNSNYNLYSPTALQLYYIGLNNKDPKLEDKRVRRAIAHLVNVDEIIEELFYGLGQRRIGPVSPTKSYYDESLQAIPFDVDKAKSLLTEAGWTDTNGNGIVDKEIDGETVEMELSFLTTNSSKFANNLAQLLEVTFPQAGVKLALEKVEFTVLINTLRSREFELFAGAWAQDPIPNDFKQLWHTDSDTPTGSNRVGFGNAKTDELIDNIRITLDEKEREGMYKEFQQIVYDEQPYVFLFAPQERIAIHKRFDTEPSSLRPGYFARSFQLKANQK